MPTPKIIRLTVSQYRAIRHLIGELSEDGGFHAYGETPEGRLRWAAKRIARAFAGFDADLACNSCATPDQVKSAHGERFTLPGFTDKLT